MEPQKNSSTRRLTISRARAFQSLIAFFSLLIADVFAQRDISIDWWLWVGIATILSSSLLEPFYTDSRSALVNSVGALGAYFVASKDGVSALWTIFALYCVVILLSSTISLVAQNLNLSSSLKWISNRLGKAAILGFSALAIEVLHVANTEMSGASSLSIGLAIAIVVSVFDWPSFFGLGSKKVIRQATLEMAISPNLILIETDKSASIGTRVLVTTSTGSSEGSVVSQMAHTSGVRLQVVLDKSWSTLTMHGITACGIEVISGNENLIGYASEGSTESKIEVHPTQLLEFGQTILLAGDGGKSLLYQITSLQLEKNTWGGANAIEPRAKASQIGSIESDGTVQYHPYLPKAYQQLLRGDSMKVSLSQQYSRLGTIFGTQIEIGINPSKSRESHLAILGMSGMGKTSVARRICEILKLESGVYALDATGEYRKRLGFDTLDLKGSLTDFGKWVYEPSGDLPQRSKEFIFQIMTLANTEYSATTIPMSRVLVMEEAHSFLPEWSFAAKNQMDSINDSCRYILQSRKFGISFVLISQRTAVISKSALSQCENYIIFRTLDQTSLEYIETIVGKQFRDTASNLTRYQAICVGPAFNSASPVIVNLDPID